MGISLKPENLKRYKDIALLIARYGRPGLLKEAGLDEVLEDGLRNPDLSSTGEALAADAYVADGYLDSGTTCAIHAGNVT